MGVFLTRSTCFIDVLAEGTVSGGAVGKGGIKRGGKMGAEESKKNTPCSSITESASSEEDADSDG